MNTNLNSFGHCSPTLRASLTGTSWVYCNYDSPGAFSLGGRVSNQSRPSSIRNVFRILFILKHALNIQILMSNKIIFIYKFLGSLMTKVFSFVFDPLMDYSQN